MKLLTVLTLLVSLTFRVSFTQETKHIKALKKEYEKSLKKKDGEKSANLAYEVGLQYESFHQDLQALEYFNKTIKHKSLDPHVMYAAYTKSGKIYFKQGEYKSSAQCFEQSVFLALQSKKTNDVIFSRIDLGLSLFKQKKYKKSIEELEDAARLSEENQLNDLALHSYDLLIQVAKKSHKTKKLVVYQEKYNFFDHLMSEQIASDAGEEASEARKEKVETERLLHEKNEELISQSWDLFNQQIELDQMSDSLNHAKELARLQNIELDLMKAQDALQQSELKEVKAEQRFQSLVITAVAIFALFISGLSILIYKNLNIHKKARLQIERKNQAISRQNQLIEDQKAEIEEDHEKIRASISYAQRIQQSALPLEEDYNNMFPKSFVFYQPRDTVSGDFYWMHKVKNSDEVLLAAIDCTGHGVPGAFMTMIAYNLLNRIVTDEVYSPEKILIRLHQEVQKSLKQEKTNNQDGMDMTVASWNPKTSKLKFSGAKNPLVLVKDGEFVATKGSKCSIGGTRNMGFVEFELHKYDLSHGDRFYMYSDGIVDQFGGEDGRKFMSKRFKQVLFESSKLGIKEQGAFVEQTIKNYMGDSYKQLDDIVVLGVEV